MDAYCDALCREMETYRGGVVDSLYIGGGTPSLLGAERLSKILDGVHKNFTLSGEATLEANPADNLRDTFRAFAAAGGNRLSLGMQAAREEELRALGRRHTMADLHRTVEDAHAAGITNLSLDLMLATPAQTAESVGNAPAPRP